MEKCEETRLEITFKCSFEFLDPSVCFLTHLQNKSKDSDFVLLKGCMKEQLSAEWVHLQHCA